MRRHLFLVAALCAIPLPFACGDPTPEPGACSAVPAVCLAVLPELGERPFSVGEAKLCAALVEIDGRLTRLEEIAARIGG